MAARRLLIVMLVLLGVSTVAAALVPVEPPSDEEETTPTTRHPPRDSQGQLHHERLSADAARPGRINVHVGDQLELAVTSRRADQVEIATLGELRDVDRDLTARFDLLLEEPGSHPIRLVDAGQTIGRIEVRPRPRARGGALILRSASPRARRPGSRLPQGSEPRRTGR